MNEKHPDQGHRKFWSMMKELIWKERVTNFLYYYGKFAIIGIFLVYMLISVMVDAFAPKPEKILAGTAINVHVSVGMEKKLTENAFAAVGGYRYEKTGSNPSAQYCQPGESASDLGIADKAPCGGF